MPNVAFNPATISVGSASTATSMLSATDNIGITSGPTTECDNGGSFANDIFTAPTVSSTTTVTCTATAQDAAGNQGSATLIATVTPVNQAPSASAISSSFGQEEGQTFSLDASASTDAETDNLTFNWTQTAGTSVTIADNTLAILANLQVPELTATETATFQVTVSDGENTSLASVNIEFQNIMQTPRFVNAPTLASSLSFSDNITTIFGETFNRTGYVGTESTHGEIELRQIELSITGELIQEGVQDPFMGNFQPSDRFFGSDILLQSTGFVPQILFFNEIFNQLNVISNLTPSFYETVSLTIPSPCAVAEQAGTVAGLENIHIGQRNSGFSLVIFSETNANTSLTSSIFKQAGTTESFCALTPITNSIQDAGFTDTNFRFLEDVLALDVDTNTLHLFGQDNSNGIDEVEYQINETVSVDLQTNEALTLIDYTPLPNAGLVMVFQMVSTMACTGWSSQE